jgi:hypothetical protein
MGFKKLGRIVFNSRFGSQLAITIATRADQQTALR